MLVRTANLARIKRIEPGPGGKLNDSVPDLIGDVSTREAHMKGAACRQPVGPLNQPSLRGKRGSN